MSDPVSPPSGARLFRGRPGIVVSVALLAVAFAFVARVALLAKASRDISWDASLTGAFATGLLYDLGAAAWVTLPIALLLAALPRRAFALAPLRWAAHVAFFLFLAVQIFSGVAEWVFWDEFGARFNFIAVDYLVYTHEVLGNIRESYPMPKIIGAIAGGALVLHLVLARAGLLKNWFEADAGPARARWRTAGLWAASVLVLGLGLSEGLLPGFANNFNRELGKNGVWSLFAAFRNNELNYDQFYATLPVDEAFRQIRTELTVDGSRPLGDDPRDTLRLVSHAGPELHPNVIQITVESLSADFLSLFNRASQLTPNLTALAEKSLVFDQLYATGTRTDRGMEALTLAIPPTPGRSLVKRPKNEGLFTLGSVFQSRGYDTAFIYGGYGYFDNMNYFFGHNGYRVIDRSAVKKEDVTFANVWGACDEDLYRWTMREADADHAAGKPFHFFVMTTSNHRPYTFPDGRIDLPSKISGRAGAVKYTDYAIGKFLADAASKPWYKNTVFVIVADHCASVAGRTELPVQNYHIPMFIFAPGGQVKPGHVKELMSQVDYPPTLLGLLNWTYASRFYGWDVMTSKGDRRALIGNYQRLGLYEPGRLAVLAPVGRVAEYDYDAKDFSLTPRTIDDAQRGEVISYYQTASYLYTSGGYRALTSEQQRQLVSGGTAERLPVAALPAPAPATP